MAYGVNLYSSITNNYDTLKSLSYLSSSTVTITSGTDTFIPYPSMYDYSNDFFYYTNVSTSFWGVGLRFTANSLGVTVKVDSSTSSLNTSITINIVFMAKKVPIINNDYGIQISNINNDTIINSENEVFVIKSTGHINSVVSTAYGSYIYNYNDILLSEHDMLFFKAPVGVEIGYAELLLTNTLVPNITKIIGSTVNRLDYIIVNKYSLSNISTPEYGLLLYNSLGNIIYSSSANIMPSNGFCSSLSVSKSNTSVVSYSLLTPTLSNISGSSYKPVDTYIHMSQRSISADVTQMTGSILYTSNGNYYATGVKNTGSTIAGVNIKLGTFTNELLIGNYSDMDSIITVIQP